MTSKNLFCKMTKNNLSHQLWAITLSVITLFLSLPLPVIMMIQNAENRVKLNPENDYIITNLLYDLNSILSMNNIWVKVVMIGLAVLCSISIFSYMHSRQKTDFYHSIPIRRNQLFATNFVTGLIVVIPAYIINFLIAVGLTGIMGYSSVIDFTNIAITMLVNIAFFMLIYSLGTVATILCGNTVISVVLMAWISFSGTFVLFAYEMLCSTFYKTYNTPANFEDMMNNSSPIISYIIAGVNDNIESFKMVLPLLMGVMVVFILITLLALKLNTIRKSEAAGSSIAFEKFKAPLKFYMVAICSIGLGLLLAGITNEFWLYIGMVIGAVLSHWLIEVIYNFDFKAIFKNTKGLLIFGVVFAIFIAVLKFDILGYDKMVPKADSIKGVNISINNYKNFDREENYLADPQNIESVLNIANKSIELMDTNENYRNLMNVYVKYYKNNGKEIKRTYNIPYDEDIVGYYNEIIKTKEFQATATSIANIDSSKQYNCEVYSIYNEKYEQSIHIDDSNAANELFQLLKDEYTNVTEKGQLVGYIEPYTIMNTENGSSSYYYTDDFILIYENYKNTIEYLQKNYAIKFASLKIEDIKYIQLYDHNGKSEGIKVTDKNDIQTILDHSESGRVSRSSEIALDSRFGIEAHYNGTHPDGRDYIDRGFILGNVPNEIINKYLQVK